MRHRAKFALLVSLLFAGSMWFYVRQVLVAHQAAEAATHHRSRGILSDLYPRWLGARELLLRHRDPYSPQVTRDIQTGYYGRPIDPSRPDDPKDQQAFAYPVYVVFLLAPTIGLPFAVVEPVFRWLLVALTVASLWMWLRVFGWRVSPVSFLALTALALGNFPVAQGILLGQLTLVVSALLAGSILALAGGQLALAGCLLAIASIKPQLVLPVAAWLSLWALSDWRKRQGFLWGLGLATLGLALGAEWVLPGWMGEFRAGLTAYQQYTGARSIFASLTNSTLGTIANGAIIVAVGALGWHSRRMVETSARFPEVAALVLAATVVVIPTTAPYNQVLLLPAGLLLLRNSETLWKSDWLTRAVAASAALCFLWPWLVSVALLAASRLVEPVTLQRQWATPLFSSFAAPALMLLLTALSIRRTWETPA